VVALRGELDMATCPLAEAELSRADALGASALLIDLSGLDFMDSTGAKLLIEAKKRARRGGRRLAVLGGPGIPHRVIDLLGIGDLLELIDDPAELTRGDGSAQRSD